MPKSVWTPPDLSGKIAVVTGASRGVGRGIAAVLGECGATVYVAARSSGASAATDGAGGTIEETAELVTSRGGRGIPVRCDASKLEDLEALFAQVKKGRKGLDILVNNAWGGYEGHPHGLPMAHYWKTPFETMWRGMFEAGVRAHMATAHVAIPLMLKRPGGLIAGTVAWDHGQYIGGHYDVSKHAIVRFLHGLSRELKRFDIAAIAVAPGFTRTGRVLDAVGVTEEQAHGIPMLARTESPEYTGRAIASLAGDPKRMRKTGQAFLTGDLAREYGFTDIDGRRVPPFRLKHSFEQLLE
jgi:NAD(P)-dependent dehydrogenase (short-subunit alcohol dehydrogenase family)